MASDILQRIANASLGVSKIADSFIGSGDNREGALLDERARYNNINGSGAPSNYDFMGGTSADLNVDGGNPTFGQRLAGSISSAGPLLLIVVGGLILYSLFKKA